MSYGVLGGLIESLLTCRMVCFVPRQSGGWFESLLTCRIVCFCIATVRRMV